MIDKKIALDIEVFKALETPPSREEFAEADIKAKYCEIFSKENFERHRIPIFKSQFTIENFSDYEKSLSELYKECSEYRMQMVEVIAEYILEKAPESCRERLLELRYMEDEKAGYGDYFFRVTRAKGRKMHHFPTFIKMMLKLICYLDSDKIEVALKETSLIQLADSVGICIEGVNKRLAKIIHNLDDASSIEHLINRIREKRVDTVVANLCAIGLGEKTVEGIDIDVKEACKAIFSSTNNAIHDRSVVLLFITSAIEGETSYNLDLLESERDDVNAKSKFRGISNTFSEKKKKSLLSYIDSEISNFDIISEITENFANRIETALCSIANDKDSAEMTNVISDEVGKLEVSNEIVKSIFTNLPSYLISYKDDFNYNYPLLKQNYKEILYDMFALELHSRGFVKIGEEQLNLIKRRVAIEMGMRNDGAARSCFSFDEAFSFDQTTSEIKIEDKLSQEALKRAGYTKIEDKDIEIEGEEDKYVLIPKWLESDISEKVKEERIKWIRLYYKEGGKDIIEKLKSFVENNLEEDLENTKEIVSTMKQILSKDPENMHFVKLFLEEELPKVLKAKKKEINSSINSQKDSEISSMEESIYQEICNGEELDTDDVEVELEEFDGDEEGRTELKEKLEQARRAEKKIEEKKEEITAKYKLMLENKYSEVKKNLSRKCEEFFVMLSKELNISPSNVNRLIGYLGDIDFAAHSALGKNIDQYGKELFSKFVEKHNQNSDAHVSENYLYYTYLSAHYIKNAMFYGAFAVTIGLAAIMCVAYLASFYVAGSVAVWSGATISGMTSLDLFGLTILGASVFVAASGLTGFAILRNSKEIDPNKVVELKLKEIAENALNIKGM